MKSDDEAGEAHIIVHLLPRHISLEIRFYLCWPNTYLQPLNEEDEVRKTPITNTDWS